MPPIGLQVVQDDQEAVVRCLLGEPGLGDGEIKQTLSSRADGAGDHTIQEPNPRDA